LSAQIGIGSVQFGMDYGISNRLGQTPEGEVAKILEYAINRGIKYIDTAAAYGTSESILGKNNLSAFNVISKFMPPSSSETILESLDDSLSRLNISQLYGYLAHRPMALIEQSDHWSQLVDLKKQEKVKKIGFSLNHPSELQALLDKGMIPEIVQAPFNYFDTRFETAFRELKQNGCEIHSRSAFLQGLFFKKPLDLSVYFEEARSAINELQQKFGKSLPGVLLKYVLSKPFIDVVIIGVENKEQLDINLNSINIPEELEEFKGKIPDSIITPSLWPKN